MKRIVKSRLDVYENEFEVVVKYNVNSGVVSVYFEEMISVIGYDKKSKTYEILGITFEEFKLHIESQWEEWMNWNNYGLYNREEKYGWDFDHIIPLSSVNTEEDIIRLNHYTNFQPLCSYVNRYVKRNKTDYESIY